MGKPAAGLTAFAVAITLSFGLLYTRPGEAHTIGLSTGEYAAKGASVLGKLAFARREIASLVPGIDTNGDGHLTAAEIESARSVLKSRVLGRIAVSAGAAPCAANLVDAGLTEEDGLLLSGRWDCSSSDSPFAIELALLDDVARGHRHIARVVTATATHDEVLFGDHRKVTIAPEVEVTVAPSSASEGSDPKLRSNADHGTGFWSLFTMGMEHIFTGYDHLVFILGLVLVRARLRSLVAVVTAFTVAHSMSLALAVLGVWAPRPSIVEPAIALSIAYVGVENFFVKDASKRWRITFPFGLIHGFGFAGALRELALLPSAVPSALVSFNLGVEAGQLVVLALLLPIVLFVRDKAWFEPRGVRLVSGAVALAGGAWFVSRVISG